MRTVRMRIATKGRRGVRAHPVRFRVPPDPVPGLRAAPSTHREIFLSFGTPWMPAVSHKIKMVTSSKNWCFTLNNWTEPELQHISDYASSNVTVVYLVAGREIGDSGTPHLQGFVCFSGRKALAQVRSEISARAHFEPSRGTPEEASTYCKKDSNFVEFGTLPPPQGHRADWDVFRQWVLDIGRVPNDLETAGRFPGLYARYPNACRTIAEAALPRPRLIPDGADLRDWQSALHDALIEECDNDRGILFYVDPEGNSGKSWFCRYMLDRYWTRTQLLGVGKVTDIAYMVDPEKDIILIDCERSASEYLQYRVLEQLKNRLVTSTKYTASMKVMRKLPHVVVMMNEEPDKNALTCDRYLIHYL